jgi:MinD superfamily P-loop ATPase
VNLARLLGADVLLLDCDVEAPNDSLFLKGATIEREAVTIKIPEVIESRCTECDKCSRFCQYHAIVSFGLKPLVFPELCHGCGGCAKVCRDGAIREVDRRIGDVEVIESGDVTLVQGRIDVGVTMSPPVIRAVKARIWEGAQVILDAPPGTSCPVVTTLRGADFVVLVTEPTPFGLHDLKLAVDMVRELGMPFGVVINRMGIGDDRVHSFCRQEEIPILAEVPDDRRIAEAYSRGRLIVDALPEYRVLFQNLIEEIKKREPIGHPEADA